MPKIPVTFTHHGRTITGELDLIHKSGECWYLFVNRYVWGIINAYPAFGEWRFTWNEQGMEVHEDYFKAVLMGWYE